MNIRQRPLAILATAAIAVLSAVTLFGIVGDVSARLDRSEAQAISRDRAVDANQKALTDANAKVTALSDQVEGLGKEPVVSPSPVTVTGERGPGPTLGQVVVAIQSYCIANGECRGAAGLTGADGAKGKTGSDGARGEGGAQGTAGLDGTNGSDGTDGKDGADGTNGTDGKDARSITSTQCGTDGRWTVTYSDGTSEDAGACQVTPGPPA